MANNIILTDIDHVILNHADHFQEWLIANKSQRFREKNWRDYINFEEWLGLDYEKSMEVITEFNKSKYFKKLTPEYKSYEFIPLLKDYGYEFIGITACGTDEKIKKNRLENLYNYFPNIFSEIYFVDNPEDKKIYLEQYEDSYWVEDSFNNAVMGSDLGHSTFLISQPYNISMEHPLIQRVPDWEEIYEILT